MLCRASLGQVEVGKGVQLESGSLWGQNTGAQAHGYCHVTSRLLRLPASGLGTRIPVTQVLARN